MWWMIPMVASMGLQYAGTMAGTKAVVSGAKSQANIEKMSREYQTRVFTEGLERQKPFYEAGKEAIPLYQKALSGDVDSEAGLAGMEKRMVEKETGSMSEHVKNLVAKRMGATGDERTKGRLMDIMQIGLGQSGSAGRSAVNLGSNLARSLQTEGGALASATLAQNVGRQTAFMGALDQLSGLPAYMAMQPGTTQAGTTSQGSVAPIAPQASTQIRQQYSPLIT